MSFRNDVRVNPGVTRDPSWLQWAVTAPLLAAHLGGYSQWLGVVLGLTAMSAIAYGVSRGSATCMPVQIRVGFFGIVGLSSLPGMGWLLWLPLAGTTSQVLIGYCPMARILRLMPWNRDSRLTLRSAGRVVFGPPGDDGLLCWTALGAGDVGDDIDVRSRIGVI
jgi:hypothetical protein